MEGEAEREQARSTIKLYTHMYCCEPTIHVIMITSAVTVVSKSSTASGTAPSTKRVGKNGHICFGTYMFAVCIYTYALLHTHVVIL